MNYSNISLKHKWNAVLRTMIILVLFTAVFFLSGLAVHAEESPVLTVKVDGQVAKTYMTIDEITAIPDALTGPLTYSGYNTYPSPKTQTVNEAVRVDKIIQDATGNDILDLAESGTVTFDADNYSKTITVRKLFETERFYYPNYKDGKDRPGLRPPESAYKNAVAVPVVLANPDDPGASRVMYGQIAPNEQQWAGFVDGMLDGGLIEIDTDTADTCAPVTAVTPASGASVKSGTEIQLPLPASAEEGRYRVFYIIDPKNGEIPGEGCDLFYYSPYNWSSNPEKTARYTNPPVITGEGTHVLAVKVYAYDKHDSEVTYFKYTVASEVAPKPSVSPVKLSKPALKLTPGKKKITLKWKKVKGASGYIIYRSTKKSSGFKRIKTIKKGNTVSFTNKKLKKGKKYYYRVKAYANTSGKKTYSAFSAVKKAKVK